MYEYVSEAEIEKKILAHYHGSSGIVKRHIKMAAKQMQQGQTIGKRMTPVVSFWFDRPKWAKWSCAWESFGTDGDVEVIDGTQVLPSVIRFCYFKTYGELVCQLAYITNEVSYEHSRLSMPIIIDKYYSLPERQQNVANSPADEIYNKMATII